MKKVIRDGKVAVLYSPRFGAGWYTWHHHLDAVFSPEIVALVEQEKQAEITDELCEKLFGEGYYGGSRDLEIEWIKEGSQFRINEYDGNESIEIIGSISYLIA